MKNNKYFKYTTIILFLVLLQMFTGLASSWAQAKNPLKIDSAPVEGNSLYKIRTNGSMEQKNFINIIDTELGSYKIEKTLVPVKKYVALLNAVAIKKDPHELYRPEMKDVIVYHSSGFFTAGYYEAVPGKADSPMSHVTFEDATRYCNWKEWGEPTAQEVLKIEQMGQEVTESGAYVFEKGINEEDFIIRNDDAIYALPNKDQLAVCIDQIGGFPYFEWTSSKTISKAPNGKEAEESWLNVALLFDQPGDEPLVKNENDTNENVGFRLIAKKEISFTSSSPSNEIDSNTVSLSQKNQTTVDTKNTKIPNQKDSTAFDLVCLGGIIMLSSIGVPLTLFSIAYFAGVDVGVIGEALYIGGLI